jgi:hypothetical protein
MVMGECVFMGDSLFSEVLILRGLQRGSLVSVVDTGVMASDLARIGTNLRMRIDSIGLKNCVLTDLGKCGF